MAGKQFTDTTDFFAIDHGDRIQVGDRWYEVLGHEKERRFGMEDPKFWVKRALDPDTGEKKYIKLSYFESFHVTFGGVKIRCFRNPDKEGEILKLIQGNPGFMQGSSFRDPQGNNIRILDAVRGPNFYNYINSFTGDHETYFHENVPDILGKLVTAFQSIQLLHESGFRHGDIRNDHIIIDRSTENYVWIDFDYDFEATENPFSLDLFSIGNVLSYAVGKGIHNLHMIDADRKAYGDLIDRVEPGDFSVLDQWRFINIRKLYPYVPQMLNDILMHFSQASVLFYEGVEEIIEDLDGYLSMTGQKEEEAP